MCLFSAPFVGVLLRFEADMATSEVQTVSGAADKARLAAAVALLVAWAVVESRRRYPMVSLASLRLRPVMLTNMSALLAGFGLYTAYVILPELVQLPNVLPAPLRPDATYGLGMSATVLWTAFTGFATVGAVAFFAAWSVLSNLFCALLIFTVGPFRLGDYIEVLDTAEKPGAKGRVVDINLLYSMDIGQWGRLRFNMNGMYVTNYDVALSSVASPISLRNVMFNPMKWRARGNARKPLSNLALRWRC